MIEERPPASEEEKIPQEKQEAISEAVVSVSIDGSVNEKSVEESGAPSLKQVAKLIKGHSDNEVIAELEKILSSLDVDQKAKEYLSFLEGSLAQSGAPRFKLFWALKKQAMDVLKELQSPLLKTQLWNEYRELSKQVKKLKEIYDEQANFAVEQMDVAIQALDQDIDSFLENGKGISSASLELLSFSLQENLEEYQKNQDSLQLLNAFAGRINTLRKELIKTDMRIGKKNKLFQHLSAIGDKIFPKRKDLIKQVSELFLHDVEKFIEEYFAKDAQLPKTSLVKVREEIKSLQRCAKDLTINTQCFNKTRDLLSNAWDRLKEFDKERKKLFTELKEQYQQTLQAKIDELQSFSNEYEEKTIFAEQFLTKLRNFRSSLRTVHLGKDELRVLYDRLSELQKPVEEGIAKAEQEKKEQQQKVQEENKKKKQDLEKELQEVLQTKNLTAEQLEKKKEEFVLLLAEYSFLTKADKQGFTNQLKKLNDLLVEANEAKLYHLSSNDKEALESLRKLLDTQKTRRKESKEQFDALRKAKSGSGLDFEQAMLQNSMINEERERLEKIDESIGKTLEQIEEIKRKLS